MIGARALRARLEERAEEMIEELRTVVSIDSPTFPSNGTQAVASHFEARYRTLGAEVERLPGSHGTGDHLLARFRGRRPERLPILIIGHCDTVFPEGEAARRPFSIEGDRARGPGVSDMKGGLVTCLFAMDSLLHAGFKEFGEIRILYDTDEERGNPSSRHWIEKLGKDASAALIIEPAREDGSLVTARKGSHYGQLHVRGVPAHAGVDPERGRSAVLELAHQIVRAYDLGTAGGTVNITGLEGGERPHIVAETASCFVELRADRQTRLESMVEDIHALLATPTLEGTTIRFEPRGGRPALEWTDGTAQLMKMAQDVGAEIGLAPTHTATGGGSDGNYLAPFGVPVLDGLGPVGGGLHTQEEYLEVFSLVPRAVLLAGLIERLAGDKLAVVLPPEGE